MNLEQQLKLQAFLDGELPEGEAREVLSWTQRDGEAALLLAELKNTRQMMAESELQLIMPETREFFWSKIERGIQQSKPRAARTPDVPFLAALRRFLLPASAVAALVIAALFAHVNSPKIIIQSVADADTPVVETILASATATTYRDASDGTTLVWFSSDSAAAN